MKTQKRIQAINRTQGLSICPQILRRCLSTGLGRTSGTVSKLKHYPRTIALVTGLLATAPLIAQVPAFPGAEGFGANASGGRGGQVIHVTNLNVSGPGSLQEALATPGPRYIVFDVGGVINGSAEILYGDVTIAGHTAPGGITIRGLIADEVYDTVGDANNIVVRHLRSRPQNEWAYPVDNFYAPDGFLISGASNVIVDHCSFTNCADENMQISETHNLSVQYCTIGEGLGDHYYLSGMLLNYSTAEHPQDNLSLHHNVWNRSGGRMPEFTCESAYCAGHPLQAEMNSNLGWDPSIYVYYNSSIDPGAPSPIDSFFVKLNLENNYYFTRSDYCSAMFQHSFLDIAGNEIYASGNEMNLYPGLNDYELFFCCNDFCDAANHPNTDMGVFTERSSRWGYPAITSDPASSLPGLLGASAGAFPRDPQDQRLNAPLTAGVIDTTPVDSSDHFSDAFMTLPPSAAPADSDGDGMPDYWETIQGLSNSVQDHNGTTLSSTLTGVPGYTNLECYLHCLSEYLIQGVNAGACGIMIARNEPNLAKPEVSIWPHPVKDQSIVQLPDVQGAILHLYDIQGREVYASAPDMHHRVILNRADFIAGIYAWTLTDATHKIVASGKWMFE